VTWTSSGPFLGSARNPLTLFFRAIAQLRACRPIPEAQVRELCHKARELLIEEGNVVTVMAPVTVCLCFYHSFDIILI
jgi:hypothetical protein